MSPRGDVTTKQDERKLRTWGYIYNSEQDGSGEVNKNILVVSHERSGTHFLINTIARNFPPYSNDDLSVSGDGGSLRENLRKYYINKEKRIFKSHHQAEYFLPFLDELLEHFHIFYIVRDGRDTITSCYHYYNQQSDDISPKSATISELLKKPADPRYCLTESTNIVQRWAVHVEGWLKLRDKITIVNYEDLSLHFEESLINIGHSLQMNPVSEHTRPTLQDWGVLPRKGIVGDWKNHFTSNDLRFFDKIAFSTMKLAGYYGNNSNSVESFSPGNLINDWLDSVRKLNREGERLLKNGKFIESQKLFLEALRLNPNWAETLNNLGVLYWQISEIQDAEKFFQQGLIVDPDHRDTIYNYHTVLTQTGKYKKAQSVLELYLSRHDNDEEFMELYTKFLNKSRTVASE